jgi:hypothetical protein
MVRQGLRVGLTVGLASLCGLFCLVCYLLLWQLVTLAWAGWGVGPVDIALITPWRVVAFLLLSTLCLFAWAALQNSEDDQERWLSTEQQVAAMQAVLDEAASNRRAAARDDNRTEAA